MSRNAQNRSSLSAASGIGAGRRPARRRNGDNTALLSCSDSRPLEVTYPRRYCLPTPRTLMAIDPSDDIGEEMLSAFVEHEARGDHHGDEDKRDEQVSSGEGRPRQHGPAPGFDHADER